MVRFVLILAAIMDLIFSWIFAHGVEIAVFLGLIVVFLIIDWLQNLTSTKKNNIMEVKGRWFK